MRATFRPIIALASVALMLTACGSGDSTNSVSAAQARVSSKEQAVADAQTALDEANTEFCKNTESYITAIDRYGKLFDQSAATVGDIKTVGADLDEPRAAVTSSAKDVANARDALATAQRELADAQAALATAQATASGSSTSKPSPVSSTTTTTLVPRATIDRVQKAEAELTASSEGITNQTPLIRATAGYNAAAFALEVSWLRLFADAGCLTSEQQQNAEAALTEYTVALQTALQTTGYYTGEIDGVYGPATVDAVKKLQSASGLPVTGFVDRATANALTNAMLSKGGTAASASIAHTAAVQATLKLAGYWSGPVDGHWTPELTDALKTYQSHLGVPPTGSVDTATLAALQSTIANAKGAVTTPPSTVPGTAPIASTATTATRG